MKQNKKEEEVKVESVKQVFDGTIEYTREDKEVVGLTKLTDENGYDLRTNKRTVFRPYATIDIKTGLRFKVPEGYELKMLSTVNVIKNVGLIPLGGQISIIGQSGELVIPMQNYTPRIVIIERGMPLGKIVVEKIDKSVTFKEVEKKIIQDDL